MVEGAATQDGTHVSSRVAISVLLPTVRPALAQRSLASVALACGDLPYEVVVVADFDMPESVPVSCIWLKKERQGVVDAVNTAFDWSSGSHVFLFNDESTLDSFSLKILHDESVRDPRCLLGPAHVPHYTFAYYGLNFVPFPFAPRDLFIKIGGLLDPVYKSFYADPDLGLRAHACGVTVRTVEQAIIRHDNGQDEAKLQNLSQYMAIDQATFRERWKHLGEFRDC